MENHGLLFRGSPWHSAPWDPTCLPPSRMGEMGRAGGEMQGSSSWLFLLSPYSQILYQELAHHHMLPSAQAWKSQGSSSLH